MSQDIEEVPLKSVIGRVPPAVKELNSLIDMYLEVFEKYKRRPSDKKKADLMYKFLNALHAEGRVAGMAIKQQKGFIKECLKNPEKTIPKEKLKGLLL